MAEEEEKDDNKANEPSVNYDRHIRIFHSFEEQEEYEREEVLKQKPEQRIKETVELILRIYGYSQETLNQRTPDNKIKVLRHE